MKSLKQGFTLVELMVVIVIIGILAALAIPRFLGATNKTKVTEFKAVLKQIYTLETAFRQESPTGSYGSLTAVGWDAPNPSNPQNQYFVYGLGAAAAADQAAGFATAAPAIPAAGAQIRLASATPQALTGQRIQASIAGNPLLTAADAACINSDGEMHAATAALASLTGATATLAAAPATCN